ncbi:MAG: hypothetical protein KC549_11290 [Myxococcales bacterium]|nr:hypothetical protein [Myxococcales bacterium]
MRAIFLIASLIIPLAGCGDADVGEACNPFPRTSLPVRKCRDDLVCVGTRDNGHCARTDTRARFSLR